jgi:ATP-binding cassette subfamily C protein
MTLRLAPGEAWAVAGPNGSGKTTLLRAVLGLAAPAEGRVLLDGQDTWRADRGALGPRLGYLPQEAQLLDGSVLENIGRFSGAPVAAAVAAARRAGVHEALGRLPRGYDSPAGPEAGLSGGQRRMVALARALLGPPRLVVLDEPEAGLDAAGRAALQGAVAAAREAGSVVLLVTHDPGSWHGRVDGVLRIGVEEQGWRAEPVPAMVGEIA